MMARGFQRQGRLQRSIHAHRIGNRGGHALQFSAAQINKLSCYPALFCAARRGGSLPCPSPFFSSALSPPSLAWSPRASALLLAGAPCNRLPAQAQQPSPLPSGYHLEATWKPGGDGGWDYLTFDPEARRLYVTRPDRVQVIDGDKGRFWVRCRGWTAVTAWRWRRNSTGASRPAAKAARSSCSTSRRSSPRRAGPGRQEARRHHLRSREQARLRLQRRQR